MDGPPIVGARGERSGLSHALSWAERIGADVYGGSLREGERDAENQWIKVVMWGHDVTKTEVWVTDWAAFWTGHRGVPGWPEDGAEMVRWAFHLPHLGVQRPLAFRLLARRLLSVERDGKADQKPALLAALRSQAGAGHEGLRAQFYRELRAAKAERLIPRVDLRTSHLVALVQLPEEVRERVRRRTRRPTVRELSKLQLTKR